MSIMVVAVIMLTCTPVLICKSICVSPTSLYEISENGGDIAKLVKQVSTEVTSQFVIEILSSGVGHSALLCERVHRGVLLPNQLC